MRRRLAQHIIRTVGQLLRASGVEAGGAKLLVHNIRVKAAVGVGGAKKQRINAARSGVQLGQHDPRIGVDIIHKQEVERRANSKRQRCKQHCVNRF